MIHAHVSVVHATKAKLGANISHSDAGHGQVVLQATQLRYVENMCACKVVRSTVDANNDKHAQWFR